jgi:hypothetical protein
MLPILYNNDIPFRIDNEVTLEIVFIISIKIKKNINNWFFKKDTQFIDICNNKLTIYKTTLN